MKTAKITKKKNVKTVKPVFTVDIRNVETVDSTHAAYGLAKQSAGLPITNTELTCIITIVANSVAKAVANITASYKYANLLCDILNKKGQKAQKKNIFKRIWDKLTGKKNSK